MEDLQRLYPIGIQTFSEIQGNIKNISMGESYAGILGSS